MLKLKWVYPKSDSKTFHSTSQLANILLKVFLSNLSLLWTHQRIQDVSWRIRWSENVYQPSNCPCCCRTRIRGLLAQPRRWCDKDAAFAQGWRWQFQSYSLLAWPGCRHLGCRYNYPSCRNWLKKGQWYPSQILNFLKSPQRECSPIIRWG